jgi:hypothetical protein
VPYQRRKDVRADGRITAVAIRLRDPALFAEASERLQHLPGVQVVTYPK